MTTIKTLWKALVALALLVPMAAYVAGALVAGAADDPAPRPPIVLKDAARPSSSPSSSSSSSSASPTGVGEVELDPDDPDDIDDHSDDWGREDDGDDGSGHGGDDDSGHSGHDGDDD